MARQILVCPFGQINGSLKTLSASLKNYNSTDANRFVNFSDLLSVTVKQNFNNGSKTFLRRYRIFSNNLQNGAKLFNPGFAGAGANAFSLLIDGIFSPVGDDSFAYYTKVAPALNEWVDINKLFLPATMPPNDLTYYFKASYTISADYTNIPAAVIAQNLPDDIQIQLEIDY